MCHQTINRLRTKTVTDKTAAFRFKYRSFHLLKNKTLSMCLKKLLPHFRV